MQEYYVSNVSKLQSYRHFNYYYLNNPARHVKLQYFTTFYPLCYEWDDKILRVGP